MMIRRDGQRRQQTTKETIPADIQICTGLSKIHKYRPVNQTTLTGILPFTPDQDPYPKTTQTVSTEDVGAVPDCWGCLPQLPIVKPPGL
jgi:hypothetical protein